MTKKQIISSALGLFIGFGLAYLTPISETPSDDLSSKTEKSPLSQKNGRKASDSDSQFGYLDAILGAKPGELESWLTGHKLDHLSSDERSLIHDLIKERWSNIDPESCAQYYLSRKNLNLHWVLKKWIAKDKNAALELFDSARPDQKDFVGSQLAKALATDAPVMAVAFLKKSPNAAVVSRETLAEISAADRDVAFSLIREDPKWKTSVIQATTAAWLTKDLAWVDARITENEMTLREAIPDMRLFTKEPIGAQIYEMIDELPPRWLDYLTEKGGLVFEAGMKWLNTKSHPALDQKSLQKIQRQVAPQLGKRVDNDELKKLFRDANWLDDQTRSGLARTILTNMIPQRRRMEEFLNQVPADLRAPAQRAFDLNKDQEASSLKRLRSSTASGFVDTLRKPDSRPDLSDLRDWGAAKINEAAREVATFSEAESRIALGHRNIYRDAPEIAARLLSNLPSDSDLFKQKASRAAYQWAYKSPEKAAEWVASLDSGEPQNLAYRSVAKQWSDFNPEGIKNWVNTLSEEAQKMIGLK